MKQNTQSSAFTLIELLMVIAIIGILAGILIPSVGMVREQANIAASKSQLSQYVNAIQMFKGEYGYYPFVSGSEDEVIDLTEAEDSLEFIETLSGRDATSGESKPEGGNRRRIAFHSFSGKEFYLDDSGEIDPTQIADRFNNRQIKIAIDGDGDGRLTVPEPSGSGTKEIRTPVTAYVEENDEVGGPDYYLYD